MILFIPALDLVNGEAVRLRRGEMSRKKVYFKNIGEPIELFAKNKVRYVHIVDLDGAIQDKPQRALFDTIAAAVKGRFSFQWAGGIRSQEYAAYLLTHGAEKIVVSTQAFLSAGFAADVLKRFPGRVVISFDLKDGKLGVKGWTQQIPSPDIPPLFREFIAQGCRDFIITDISSDGTMHGARIDFFASIMKGIDASFYIAGGIASEKDLALIRDAQLPSLQGVIVGKAFYEGRISLERAQKVLNGVI